MIQLWKCVSEIRALKQKYKTDGRPVNAVLLAEINKIFNEISLIISGTDDNKKGLSSNVNLLEGELAILREVNFDLQAASHYTNN